ncbi:MAG: LCP family protein [Anaerolineales bacterium]|nr:LCP family protein [Anaerolineales bacterium]
MTPPPRPTPRPNRRRREPLLPSWGIGALIGLFVLATGLAAYLVFTSVRDFVAGWQITGQSAGGPPASSGGQVQTGTGAGSNNGGAPAPNPIVPQKWTGADRVTILLLGIDRRSGDTDRAFRTDSIMILSLDPVAKSAVILSIPRDLWVEIPGFDNAKITEANFKGDAFNYPGGGPALAVRTVEHNLGVTINYYVRLDFTAFEALIDAIGGIEVDNPTAIDDPWYPDGSYGYEPFYLPAGRQHLNGHDALRYARTRHDSSDVARAGRQQQVVMAVRDKVVSLDMLPQLLLKAPTLYQALNESIQTDLTLDQIVALALLAPDIPRENVTQAVIDYQYVLEYTTPDGLQVLVPQRDKIRELRDELFRPAAALAAPAQDDPALRQGEAAKVEVLNGAGVEGLARATAEWLQGQGVNVVNFDTADRSDYTGTVIVDYTGKPYTTRWLARTFNVASVVNGADPNSSVDVRVILGQDWQVPQP